MGVRQACKHMASDVKRTSRTETMLIREDLPERATVQELEDQVPRAIFERPRV